MAVVASIARLLDARRVDYRVVTHLHTDCSSETAQAAHVSGERIAKAVLLKDAQGYCLAVIPATHALQMEVLNTRLERRLHLAGEDELLQAFPDCELGAVPALGRAYGIATMVDEQLLEQPEVYFEAGEHRELVCVSARAFERLMDGASYGTFSVHRA
jgi:Ala-tRNA(Pro) deacylase